MSVRPPTSINYRWTGSCKILKQKYVIKIYRENPNLVRTGHKYRTFTWRSKYVLMLVTCNRYDITVGSDKQRNIAKGADFCISIVGRYTYRSTIPIAATFNV